MKGGSGDLIQPTPQETAKAVGSLLDPIVAAADVSSSVSELVKVVGWMTGEEKRRLLAACKAAAPRIRQVAQVVDDLS